LLRNDPKNFRRRRFGALPPLHFYRIDTISPVKDVLVRLRIGPGLDRLCIATNIAACCGDA